MKLKRKKLEVVIEDQTHFMRKVLKWANGFDRFVFFNSNNYDFPHQPYKNFIGIGTYKTVNFRDGESFESLQGFLDHHQDYVLGHFTYDLKNEIEKLSSNHESFVSFKPISFFIPITVISFGENITIESYHNPTNILSALEQETFQRVIPSVKKFRTDVSKETYMQHVDRLKEHIVEGDIYEINYCHQFISENIILDPVDTYFKLNEISPAPFSTLYKNQSNYLISASPERFIKKENSSLISQPIKGTAPRSKDKEIDEQLKRALQSDEKERAENMMIVDLVRNDLAKSCKPGTVRVEEIFGIYSFPLWHQMISTVTGQIKDEFNPVECIKNAFPMGSMTGAPKIKVMELIEQYEIFKRNLYSGSVGYFLPNGDFDFNVVIRSLLYNAEDKKASFAVGSAITYDSDPEKEYDECMLKAKTFTSLFNLSD